MRVVLAFCANAVWHDANIAFKTLLVAALLMTVAGLGFGSTYTTVPKEITFNESVEY